MLYSKNDKDNCHNDNKPCHDDNKSCQGLCAGRKMMNNETKMKQSYSKYALAVFIFGVVATTIQLLVAMVLVPVFNINTDNGWFSFANVIIPLYLIAFPILILITRKAEVKVPEKHSIKFGKFIVFVLLMFGMVGVGAVIGTILNYLVMLPFGLNPSNNTGIVKIMMNSNPVIRIVTAGILAPIVEELIFRKFLIDRTYRYGEWTAILTSGLMFGLSHGNLAQFFFTTLIGGLLAYIYIRTGKIWYTIALHMTLNLATSVVTMFTMQNYLSVDPELMNEYASLSSQYLASGGDPALQQRMMEAASQVIPKMMPFIIWMGFFGQLVLVGIILWIVFLAKKKFTIKRTEEQVEHGMRFAWGNIGMILFIVYIVVEFGLNFYQLVAGSR